MARSDTPRLLLLLPSTTYRATAFIEAARQLGVEVTVASELPSTFERAQPTGLLTLDFADPVHAAEQAHAFAVEHPLAGVVGVDDDTAVVAAAIATRLGLRGNSIEAALAARDKYQQREKLSAARIPVPRFTLYSSDVDPEALSREIAYPCVLKPLRLSASRGVMRADNPSGFVTAFRRLGAILAQPDVAACGAPSQRLLVEEFIPGPEVALEGLLAGGRLQLLALFDKPDPLDGPFFEETIYVTPSRLPVDTQRAIIETTQAAATALGLVEGPVHAELRHNTLGPWLIELAARPIGGRCSAAIRFDNGEEGEGRREASLEELVVRHSLGMDLPALQREDRASGVMMIPVPRAGALREVRGLDEARAVPLIDALIITAHQGQQFVPLPEGARYPGFIFARGERPEQVEAALRQAHQQLEFVIQ